MVVGHQKKVKEKHKQFIIKDGINPSFFALP